MKRVLMIVGMSLTLVVLLRFFPLFHIVPLDQVGANRQSATFSTAEFVEQFWDERLVPALDSAAPAADILAAIRESPVKARRDFGRTAGLGRNCFFFLRGRGTIVSIEPDRIGVSLVSSDKEPDFFLHTGLLFGNAARDATGLLNASDFANSQHFNDVSTQLNRIIETSVIPTLRTHARLGGRLQFTGCVEIRGEQDLQPLSIVPLAVHFD